MPKSIVLRDLDARPGAAQAALDACGAQGGGEVVVPPGRWSLGDLRLRSGVTLHLASGCTLAGTVLAEDVEDVAIVGDDPATVHLDGGVRLERVRGVVCRAYSGCMTSGRHVSDGVFEGLVLHQAPQRQAEGSVVWFAWARDLRFADCDLESNDDVFCLKRAAEDVTLTRSRLCGRLAAPFKIGTESDGLFRAIRFTDSRIESSDRGAVSLESVDGAEIRDVEVARIAMKDVNVPLFIRLGDRDRYGKGRGRIRGILIHDITGYGDMMDEGYGSAVSGLPGRPIEDVVLRDIRFTSRGGQPAEPPDRPVPERAELYPEFDMFGRLPAHGLYARHVRGLHLERVAFAAARTDGRPAIVCEDVAGLEVVATAAPVVRAVPAAAPPGPALPARDPEALLAAIRAARPGETVLVEPGDYAIPRERLPIAIDREGLTLRSREGPERTRLRAVGARENDAQQRALVDPDAARRADALFLVTADRATIEGLTLSAAVYNVYVGRAADCAVIGNRFDFAKCYHVYGFEARGLRVAGNRSRAVLNNAVKLDRCEDCTVADNTFHEDPAGVRLSGSSRNTIARNRFLGLSWHGMMLEKGSHGNRIEGNLFADGRLTGLQIRESNGNEIVGNEFRGQKTESVLIDRGSRDNRLRHNRFHSNRGLAVSNETPYPVDARENWWGSPSGPGPGAQVDANVLVEPHLAAPPAPATDPSI